MFLAWFVRIVTVLGIFGTLLPLLQTGSWFIRGWDFPRFQLAALFLILICVAFVCRHKFTGYPEFAAWLVLLALACIWQTSHVVKFTPVWPREVSSSTTGDSAIRLLVVNLDYQNTAHQVVMDEIRDIRPDVLILIEIDQAWDDGLSSLRQTFQYHHDEVLDDGLGMAVWSDLPLRSAHTRFLVEEHRPSLWAEIEHHEMTTNLVAIHPTPPGLQDSTGETRRDSRVRDAELVMIAREIVDRPDEAWIVAGDFNDVAWSHTTRLFKRLSGLRDPRVGRSFMGTYHADYPLIRFPIDHVFLSEGFAVTELARRHITGSDHFGVFAAITIGAPSPGVSPAPSGDDRAEAQTIVKEGINDAQQRDASGNAAGRSESPP